MTPARTRRPFSAPPTPASKPMLYPPGTNLADVPPLARGLTEMEYMDYCLAKCPREFPAPEPVRPAPARKRR